MPNAPRRSLLRAAALIWLAVVLASACFVIFRLVSTPPESDVRALLPDTEAPAAEERLKRSWTARNEQRLTLILERPGADERTLRADAVRLDELIARIEPRIAPVIMLDGGIESRAAESVVLRAAARSMTLADEAALPEMTPEMLGASALTSISAPVSAGAAPFTEDPLQIGARWAAERAADAPFTPVGRVFCARGEVPALAVFFKTNASPVTEGEKLAKAGDALLGSVRSAFADQGEASRAWLTGLPVFTQYAAAKAQSELTLLGSLSLAAVILLAFFWFSRIRTLLAVLVVTLSSFASAVAAVLLTMGSIHLITLVFGTTLIGITVDYAAHYFCQRMRSQGEASESAETTARRLAPNLALAFVSTALAFGAMALAPLPGLRQMAVFGIAGIGTAFFGVLLWLPLVEREPMPFPNRTRRTAAAFSRLPSVDALSPAARFAVLAALAAACLAGMTNLRLSSSLYELNSAPPSMVREAGRTSEILNAPAISQYFLVTANTQAERLEREEALERALSARKSESDLARVSLLSESDWHASPRRQAVIDRIRADVCRKTNAAVEPVLGASLGCLDAAAAADSEFDRTALESLLPPAFSDKAGSAALVFVTGLDARNIDAVASLADGIPGVHWRNIPAEIAQTLSLYRDRAGMLLAAGFALIVVVLTLRFGRRAWRAYAPTAFALLLTVGILGALGQPITLFTVLAGVLLVGLGVDYGIFLTAEGGGTRDVRTYAAVLFAGLTTMASFGALALSATPALHGFGCTVAVGETLILILTPWLREIRAGAAD